MPCQLQQIKSSIDIGFDKGIGFGDGPINMRFGGKMADGIDLKGIKDLGHGGPVADVRFQKGITIWKPGVDTAKIFRVSGIGQRPR